MEKVVRIFKSHAEADAADEAFYRSLTPQERLSILLPILKSHECEYTELLPSFIAALNKAHVNYIIVGGYAAACHAVPRFTKDMDIFVRATPENFAKVAVCISSVFPDANPDIVLEQLNTQGRYQIGDWPNSVDIHTAISGVSFKDAWLDRFTANIGNTPALFIGREAIIANKQALGRYMDMADLEVLVG